MSPLLPRLLIALAGLCLLPAPSAAEGPATKAPHPCLENRFATPLPTAAHFRAPADISASPSQIWLLAGLIIEHLKPESLAQSKRKAIEAALKRQGATAFTQPKAKPDRRGRRAAFVQLGALAEKEEPLLQERLAELGLARIDVEKLSPACARHLLASEHIARQAKSGLWKDPTYQAKSATGLHLSAIVSTYQMIHGKVLAVTRKPHGISYLNFGSNWQKDFTVTLDEKSLARWEAENKSLDALKNAYIYVRGWVETRGGPLIRVQHPAQLWQERPAK